MSENHLVAARDTVVVAFDGLCAGMRARGGQDLIDHALLLARTARHLLDLLDQDGPAPDPDTPQVNELYLSPVPGRDRWADQSPARRGHV